VKKKNGKKKVAKVMREFKSGTLHSGKKGPVVKSRKQAIAIAMSEAGMAKKKAKKK
jgi:ribosomal protein L21E